MDTDHSTARAGAEPAKRIEREISVLLQAAEAETAEAGPDAELIARWQEWKKTADESLACEMEVRRLTKDWPADLPMYPVVRVPGRNGGTFAEPAEIDEWVERLQRHAKRAASAAEAAEGQWSDDAMVARIVAEMCDREAARAEGLREGLKRQLADILARLEEYEERIGLKVARDQRDAAGIWEGKMEQELISLTPVTQAGFLAMLDLIISHRGINYDPEDWEDETLQTIGRNLEAATGLKLTSPARCRAYKEG